MAVAWNALAEGIQGEQNYNTFKRKLKWHNLHCIYFVSYNNYRKTDVYYNQYELFTIV